MTYRPLAGAFHISNAHINSHKHIRYYLASISAWQKELNWLHSLSPKCIRKTKRRKLLASGKPSKSPSTCSPQSVTEESKAGGSRRILYFRGMSEQQPQQNSKNLSAFILETSSLLYPELIFSALWMLMVQPGSTCVSPVQLEGGAPLTHSTQILTQPTQEGICRWRHQPS